MISTGDTCQLAGDYVTCRVLRPKVSLRLALQRREIDT